MRFDQKQKIGMQTETIVQIVHLICFAAFYGTLFYSTYIMGPKLFLNLKRPEFSLVQGILFPMYFMLGVLFSVILFGTFVYLHSEILQFGTKHSSFVSGLTATVSYWIQEIMNRNGTVWTAVLFLYAAIASATEWLYVGPVTTEIMNKRDRAKDQADKMQEWQRLQKQFSKWHGINSSIDLSIFVAMNAVLIMLSLRIKV